MTTGDNEEQSPDVRYEWRPSPDGVPSSAQLKDTVPRPGRVGTPARHRRCGTSWCRRALRLDQPVALAVVKSTVVVRSARRLEAWRRAMYLHRGAAPSGGVGQNVSSNSWLRHPNGKSTPRMAATAHVRIIEDQTETTGQELEPQEPESPVDGSLERRAVGFHVRAVPIDQPVGE